MGCGCSPSTGVPRRGLLPYMRCSIVVTTVTVAVLLGIMLHPNGADAATVLQSSDVDIPPKYVSRSTGQSSEVNEPPHLGLRVTSAQSSDAVTTHNTLPRATFAQTNEADIPRNSLPRTTSAQSSGMSLPTNSAVRAEALRTGNTSMSRPHKSSDNYWARFGHRNKTSTGATKDKLTSGKEGAEPAAKPFSECHTINEAGPKDDINPEEDNLLLENMIDEIKVHLAVNDSIVTDPANIRPRIYRREAARSLLQELRKEAGFQTDENDEILPEVSVMNTPAPSSPKMLNVTVTEGARVRLVCNVTGVPDYWVEWRRWSNLTFPGGEEVVGGRSVLFDQVGREDAGKYHCTARTTDGLTHSVSLMLYVKFMPEVSIWARGGGANGEVELGCLSQGYPQPQLAWYINNTKISNSVCPHGLRVSVGRRFLAPEWTLSLLRLKGLSAHAHGFYHCTAANSEARAQAVVMLHQGDMSLQPVLDRSMVRSLNQLKEEMKDRVKNQMSVFVMGMVPPMYIAFYIIVYLSCYKSQSIVGAAIGRNGGDTSDKYSAGYPME